MQAKRKLTALLLSLWISFWLDSWWGGVLLFLPLTESLKNGIDFVVTKVVPPRCLFRLELKAGIPAEGKTLCVIATLLTGAESGQELAQKLERYRLANRQAGENLRFGLLADLPDSGKPMGAEQRQWVANAKAAINTLNERYNGGFFLFFRSPTYLRRPLHGLGAETRGAVGVGTVLALRPQRIAAAGRRSGRPAGHQIHPDPGQRHHLK